LTFVGSKLDLCTVTKLDIVENDLSESALDAGVENVDCASLVNFGVRICDFQKKIVVKFWPLPKIVDSFLTAAAPKILSAHGTFDTFESV
jgi:hypothetical protein